ncbi:MAG: hypothetical protein IJ503_01075 [Akkermansia sp.]|nr:hypothetical protein [Akkermansia sp.]
MSANKWIEHELLPGERMLYLHRQKRGWKWWRRWVTDVFERATPIFFLLLLPLGWCCLPLAPDLLLFWFTVVLVVLVCRLLGYIGVRMREWTCLAVTSHRVICMQRADGRISLTSYPLPMLTAVADGRDVRLEGCWFGADVRFRGVAAPAQLVALIEQAQTAYIPFPRPVPQAGTHPLLPAGELLYGAGVEVAEHPSRREWCILAGLLIFCSSVVVSALAEPQDGAYVGFGWVVLVLMVGLVMLMLWAYVRRFRRTPDSFAIGSSGVYMAGWEPCPAADCYPFSKDILADGSILLFFLPGKDITHLPALHIRDEFRQVEALLMALAAVHEPRSEQALKPQSNEQKSGD